MNSPETLPVPSMYTVRAAIILDQDGRRLLAKYYDDTFPSLAEQREFERRIFLMSQRSECEVVLVDGVTALCQRLCDITCYIVGGPQENELLLLSALTCLSESLCRMLRVILESESDKVVQRLSFKTISEPAFGFVLFDYLTGNGESSDSKKRTDVD
ncbi:coatomer subunit zeta-2 isoform X2 [Spea bombifrons]|uniref:coatomer subunit zeta-2 isoform X2 n=1 Tax=Spea bombifrons TaxID=233779 RepID=UPI00234B1F08|nr:coatomer subunit zeta-2 isoform X2 [Spea bombifrons]